MTESLSHRLSYGVQLYPRTSRVCTRRLIPVWLSLISDRYRLFIWMPALMRSCLWSCAHPSVGALGPYKVVPDAEKRQIPPGVTCIVFSLARVVLNSHPRKRRLERATSIPRASAMMIVIMIMISRHHNHASPFPFDPQRLSAVGNGRVVRDRRLFDERMMRQHSRSGKIDPK